MRHVLTDQNALFQSSVPSCATMKFLYEIGSRFIQSLVSSVTRFGEMSQLWQNFIRLWHVLSLLWQIWYIIGLILIVANGQILKNNLTIWSHCSCLDRRYFDH